MGSGQNDEVNRYIHQGDTLFKEAQTLDEQEKFKEAKEKFKLAGQCYKLGIELAQELGYNSQSYEAYKKYKLAESYFYAMDYRGIIKKNREQ